MTVASLLLVVVWQWILTPSPLLALLKVRWDESPLVMVMVVMLMSTVAIVGTILITC